MKPKKAFNEFRAIVGDLQQITRELVAVIDKQTQAVVSADREKIERYSEEYTSLKGSFKEQENRFINHLQALTADSDKSEDVKLDNLKNVFPQSESLINDWQESLDNQTRNLKQKHQELNTLLEFAVEQNVELMQSIYSLHNQKNTRYSSKGSKEEVSSGIAVNKEA